MNILRRMATGDVESRGMLLALASSYAAMGGMVVAQLVLTPLYLSALGSYRYGILMLMLNTINTAALGIVWVSGGGARLLAEKAGCEDRMGFSVAFSIIRRLYTNYGLALGVAGATVGLWLVSRQAPSEFLGDLRTAVVLAAIFFVISYNYAAYRFSFPAIGRYHWGNWLDLGNVVLAAVLAAGLVLLTQTLSAVWVAMILAILAQRGGGAVLLTRAGWRAAGGDSPMDAKAIWKWLLSRRAMGYVAYGMLLLALQADIILVGVLGGPETVTKFVLLWKIPEFLVQLLWRIPAVLEPQVIRMEARGQHAEIHRLFRSGLRWYAAAAGLAAVGYAVFGHGLVTLWVGEHAPAETWSFAIAGAALFFYGLARWPAGFAYAQVRLRPLVAAAAFEFALKLVLTLALFPILDYAAPPAAWLLAQLCGGIWLYLRAGQPGKVAV